MNTIVIERVWDNKVPLKIPFVLAKSSIATTSGYTYHCTELILNIWQAQAHVISDEVPLGCNKGINSIK